MHAHNPPTYRILDSCNRFSFLKSRHLHLSFFNRWIRVFFLYVSLFAQLSTRSGIIEQLFTGILTWLFFNMSFSEVVENSCCKNMILFRGWKVETIFRLRQSPSKGELCMKILEIIQIILKSESCWMLHNKTLGNH